MNDYSELVEALRRMSPRLDMLDCETVLQAADALQRAVLAAEARGLERAAQTADDWFYDPEEDVVTDRRLGSEIRALITDEMRKALEQEQGK